MIVFPELAASLQAVLYLLSLLLNIYEAPAAWVQIADGWEAFKKLNQSKFKVKTEERVFVS